MFGWGRREASDRPTDIEAMGKPVAPERSATTKWKGMYVTFDDIAYDVPSNTQKGETVRLLHGVNGFLEPGKMTCLMGPSGSGKTTLLDILAGRKTTGTISGKLLYGGEVASKTFLRRYTGYVEQFDTLLPMLTPYEMLLYTAELKLPADVSREEKRRRVESVIKKLSLQSCRDVRIGNVFARGISGGQAKRTNIGIALVAEPRVLFLDEPTSGLDSYTSNEVMAAVQAVARSGITVCATVHSPSAYAFRLFDSLLMLLRGRTIYFGPQGKPALEHFLGMCKTLSHCRPFEIGDNPAEWLVDVTTGINDEPEEVERMAAAYEKSDVRAREMKRLAAVETTLEQVDEDFHAAALKMNQVRSETEVGFFHAFSTFFRYRIARNLTSGDYLGPRIGDKILIALIIFSLYWGVGDKDADPSGMTNISAVLFMWSTMPGFGAAAYVPAITLERALYVRERHDGLYTPLTYLLCKFIEEFLVVLPSSLLVSAIVFYALNLAGSFAIFWLTYLFALLTGIVLAYFVASASPNMDVANAALPAYVVTLLFFGGFLIRYQDQPRGWRWYSRIAFLRYAWSALMVNQFEDNDNLFAEGSTVLEFYDLDGETASDMMLLLLPFFAFFFTLAWAALRFMSFQKR